MNAPILFALNRLIAQETWAQELLRGHGGKAVELELGTVCVNFKIDEVAARLIEQPESDKGRAPNVRIQVPWSAITQALQGQTDIGRQAQVSGEAGLARDMERLLTHLRPDLGALLAPAVGDILAHRVQQGANSFLQGVQSIGRGIYANVAEYARYEQTMLMNRAQRDEYAQALADLSRSMDALEKRLNALRK